MLASTGTAAAARISSLPTTPSEQMRLNRDGAGLAPGTTDGLPVRVVKRHSAEKTKTVSRDAVNVGRFDLAAPHGTLYVGDHLGGVAPEAVREPDVTAAESQRAYNDRRLSAMPLDRFYGTRIADFTSGAVRYFSVPVGVASLTRAEARPWARAAHAGGFGGILYRLRDDPERRLGLALFGDAGPADAPDTQPFPQPLPVGLRQEVLRLFEGGYRGDPLVALL